MTDILLVTDVLLIVTGYAAIYKGYTVVTDIMLVTDSGILLLLLLSYSGCTTVSMLCHRHLVVFVACRDRRRATNERLGCGWIKLTKTRNCE